MRPERPPGGVLPGARVRPKPSDKRGDDARQDSPEPEGRAHSIPSPARPSVDGAEAVLRGPSPHQQHPRGVPRQPKHSLPQGQPGAQQRGRRGSPADHKAHAPPVEDPLRRADQR